MNKTKIQELVKDTDQTELLKNELTKDIDPTEVLRKADNDEELTVEEVVVYEKLVKPKILLYGKYGSLAKIYLEEHNPGKHWSLAGDLPGYLHNIDKQASDLYDALYTKLSNSDRFKKTGDFLTDLRLETEKQRIIEEEILNEIVYVD